MTPVEALRLASERWPDKKARLSDGFYKIKNEQGEATPFRMRPPQAKFLEDKHGFDIVLKARQLGFTTLIQLDMLDDCLFNPNISAGIVAHNKEDAEAFFDDKIKFAYDSLPQFFRDVRPATQDSAKSLQFNNGSRIRVGTSLRSGTFQRLHISEYGKVCAKYPEKAREIQTGALNTVHAGQQVTIESTAEGQGGNFYDMCQEAMKMEQMGQQLSAIDFKFHFFPWWMDDKYKLSAEYITIPQELTGYFERLEQNEGIKLSPEQRAWYYRKHATQQDDMKREFPATPKEAFEAAIEGAYFAKELERCRMRGNIRNIQYDENLPVFTFWDLGIGDKMCIWFFQLQRGLPVMIDYYENHSEGMRHYAEIMRERPYLYGRHYIPHDGKQRTFETAETKEQVIHRLTGVPVTVVTRTLDVTSDIQLMRNVIPLTHFDLENTDKGVGHLAGYRRVWDIKRGTWLRKPEHNDASNGADAYRTFAVCWANGWIETDNYNGGQFDDEYYYEDEQNDHRDAIGGY